MMGGWLDWVILWVFSNLGDSTILLKSSEIEALNAACLRFKKKKKAMRTELGGKAFTQTRSFQSKREESDTPGSPRLWIKSSAQVIIPSYRTSVIYRRH